LDYLPGQPIVIVATRLLTEHAISGQSRSEDAHLRARLDWDHRVAGTHPALLAASRRLHPGPSLLPIKVDDRVDELRARKRTGGDGPAQQAELERTLLEAAQESWDDLVRARRAFLALDLPPLPGLDKLEADALRELRWLLDRNPGFARTLGSACDELQIQEWWRARLEDLEARGDAVCREMLREQGRVVAATTTLVRLGKGAANPTKILVRTTQSVLRIRPGTRLKTEDGRVEAIVRRIHWYRSVPGTTAFLLHVTKGKRAAAELPIGQSCDWFDTVIFPIAPPRRPAGASPGIPEAVPVKRLGNLPDLLHLAKRLRRI
jgi:hypothetical protein